MLLFLNAIWEPRTVRRKNKKRLRLRLNVVKEEPPRAHANSLTLTPALAKLLSQLQLPRRLMVRRQTLDLLIEVRILTGQQKHCGSWLGDCRPCLQSAITSLKSAILMRPYRLTVRTEPSQGSNTGSIPVKATTPRHSLFALCVTS